MSTKWQLTPLIASLLVVAGCVDQLPVQNNAQIESGPSSNKLNITGFSYEIAKNEKSFGLLASDDVDQLLVDGVVHKVAKGQIVVDAKDDTVIGQVTQDLGGKVTWQQSIFEDQPKIVGSPEEGNERVIPPTKKKFLPFYVVEVPSSDSDDVSDLPAIAEQAGVKGHYVFPSPRVASHYRKIWKAKQAYAARLKNVTHNGVTEPASVWAEGSTTSSTGTTFVPGSSEMWWAGTWATSKGITMNTASLSNPSGDSIYTYTDAYDVKVAVIDAGFQGQNEAQCPTQIVRRAQVEYDPVYGAMDVSGIPDIWGSYGHGRMVASLIFAPHNDSAGTVGTANQAAPYLIASGHDNVVKAGIDQCALWGVKVVNMSFNTSTPLPNTADSIRICNDYYSMIFVGAAGNNGDTSSNYPASYPNVIQVGAHNQSGGRAVWPGGSSNSIGTDIWAPGVGIAVASNFGTHANMIQLQRGTSLASPMVAGVVAGMVKRGYVTNSTTALTRLQSKGYYSNSIVHKALNALACVKSL